MPVGYTIDLARSLVLSRGWGVVTDREILAHARALTADPRFERSFHQLADLREVTDARVTDFANKQMLVRLNPFGAGARRAMVVTCTWRSAWHACTKSCGKDRLTSWRSSGKWMTPFNGLGSPRRKRNCFRPSLKRLRSLG